MKIQEAGNVIVNIVISGAIVEANMSSITLDGNSVIIQTPYNPDLVDALKKAIPYTERRWDNAKKLWIVDRRHAQMVIDMIHDHSGEKIALQQSIFPRAITEIRILDIRYVGITKERPDGSWTAFGWCDNNWSVIFPEAILRAWFEGVQTDHQPNQAGTLYSVLGIKRDATQDGIKTAFRRMAFQWHPDRCQEPGAQERFIRIKEAYDLLSEPGKRARYDAGLALEATLDPRLKQNYIMQPNNGYRSPLRCGYILAEVDDNLGRFLVSRILGWEDIHDDQGRTLVVSWAYGADSFSEVWV
jgi:hypothetical protein